MTQHQCLLSTVKHFKLACHPGHQLHIVTAVRGYSKEAVPGSRNCPYSTPECTLRAKNVINMCNKEQNCTMKVAAAIQATIWKTNCAGQTVSTNFIQVNYTCEPGRSFILTKKDHCDVLSYMWAILL